MVWRRRYSAWVTTEGLTAVSQVTHISPIPGSERSDGVHHRALADEDDTAQARVASVGLQEHEWDKATTVRANSGRRERERVRVRRQQS